MLFSSVYTGINENLGLFSIIMDCVYTNLLTVDDMRRILQQRELRIPNIDTLSYEELLQIFKSFAVPLQQRDGRKNKTDMDIDSEPDISQLKRVLPSPVDHCANKMSRVTLNINFSETLDSSGKRKLDCNMHPGKQCVSKRLKITWP